LGSVADWQQEAGHMKKPLLLALGAEIILVATAVLFLALHSLWNTFIGVGCVAGALMLAAWLIWTPRQKSADSRTVGVGTVCTVDDDESFTAASDERQIWIEVTSVQGDTFIGRLVRDDGDPDVSTLRPGLVVLVAFDPAAREQLSLPDDVLAVRAACLDPI
jgi:hypothetical protein